MPRGSPDWVQSASDHLLGYTDVVTDYYSKFILAGNTETLFDQDGVGVMGHCIVNSSDKSLSMEIYLDGQRVMITTPDVIGSRYGLGLSNKFPIFGCSLFDEIANIYGFWVDFDFKLVFYSNLKIQLVNNTAGGITVGHARWHYKLRD